MLCLKIELYLSPSTAGSTDSCSCACHDGPDQSLPDSGLVWYKPLSIFFLMHACGEVITIDHFSVTKAQTFDSTQWHLVEDITHLSMLIFFPREPSLLHSPSSAILFSSCLSLLVTRRSASTGPIHQVMTPAVSFPLTVVNLKRKRSLQCGGEGCE